MKTERTCASGFPLYIQFLFSIADPPLSKYESVRSRNGENGQYAFGVGSTILPSPARAEGAFAGAVSKISYRFCFGKPFPVGADSISAHRRGRRLDDPHPRKRSDVSSGEPLEVMFLPLVKVMFSADGGK